MPDTVPTTRTAFATPWFGPEHLQRFSRNYERFVRDMIDITTQQVELTRDMIEAGTEDMALLSQAHTPDALLRAEMEVFRKRSERAFNAAMKISGSMQNMVAATMAAYTNGEDKPPKPV